MSVLNRDRRKWRVLLSLAVYLMSNVGNDNLHHFFHVMQSFQSSHFAVGLQASGLSAGTDDACPILKLLERHQGGSHPIPAITNLVSIQYPVNEVFHSPVHYFSACLNGLRQARAPPALGSPFSRILRS
jgi:hypothetical protein